MRFCFVTPEFLTEPFFSGGLANYLGRVTVALAERGHDVHVITRSSQEGQLDYRGVTVHRVVPLWDKRMILDHADPLVPKVFYNAYQDWKAAWCLWRRWRKLSGTMHFDMVQVANVTAVGLWFRFERKVPVVMRMSSSQLEWDALAGTPIDVGVRARWQMQVGDDIHAQARMKQMHDLIELMTGWLADVQKMDSATLVSLMKMGAKVQKLLEVKGKIASTMQAGLGRRSAPAAVLTHTGDAGSTQPSGSASPEPVDDEDGTRI